jgi:hypothetical protein
MAPTAVQNEFPDLWEAIDFFFITKAGIYVEYVNVKILKYVGQGNPCPVYRSQFSEER